MKLFAIYIGGEFPGANIEVHDVRFVVANAIEETYATWRRDWWGVPRSLHRLRRTARFIATTTYADRCEAEAMIWRVRSVHDGVKGHLADGTPYDANDPMLLAWVHVTETRSFLDAWIRYGEPWMSRTDQDRYFAEMALIGGALGAEPLPRTRAEADRLIAGMRPALQADARTAEVARLILHPPAANRLASVPGRLAGEAGVDLLPRWARALHGLSPSPLRTPLVRAGTLGVAQALRWAFK